MRNNPRDWSIEDILAIAQRNNIVARRPGGSHVILTFPAGREISIPAHKPLKLIYIKKFLEVLDAQVEED